MSRRSIRKRRHIRRPYSWQDASLTVTIDGQEVLTARGEAIFARERRARVERFYSFTVEAEACFYRAPEPPPPSPIEIAPREVAN